jgi:hypothetical protein
VRDPSLLRFLVDLRGADLSAQQLRDDLMTMLIAGHETTAAVLTWALYSVATQPTIEVKLMQEIDSVLGDNTPGMDNPVAAMVAVRHGSTQDGCCCWIVTLSRVLSPRKPVVGLQGHSRHTCCACPILLSAFALSSTTPGLPVQTGLTF